MQASDLVALGGIGPGVAGHLVIPFSNGLRSDVGKSSLTTGLEGTV